MTRITTEDQNNIERAIRVNIPGLSTDAARTLLGVMEGLLMGMNPGERASAIAALSTSPSAASAVALTNYAAEAERLQNESLLNARRLEQRRREAELATDPAQARRDLLHILRTQNVTSGSLLAAAAALLGGSSNIAEAWARYAAERREQQSAATLAVAYLMAYDETMRSSPGYKTTPTGYEAGFARISNMSQYAPAYEERFWSQHYRESPHYSRSWTWGDNPEQTLQGIPEQNRPLVTAMVQQERQRLAQRLGIPLDQVTATPPIHFNGRPVTLERAIEVRRATNDDQVRMGTRSAGVEGDNQPQPGTVRRIISAIPSILSTNPEDRQASRNEAMRGVTGIAAGITRRYNYTFRDWLSQAGIVTLTPAERLAQHERAIQAHQAARQLRIGLVDNVLSPIARGVDTVRSTVSGAVNDYVVAPVVGAVNNYVVAPIREHVVAPIAGAVNNYVVAPVASAYNNYVAAPAAAVGSWFRRQYNRVVGNTPQPEVVATGLPTGDQVVVAGPSSAPSAVPASAGTLPAAATVVRQDTVPIIASTTHPTGAPTVCTADDPQGTGNTTARRPADLISQYRRPTTDDYRAQLALRTTAGAIGVNGAEVSRVVTEAVARGQIITNDGTATVAAAVVTAVGTGTGTPVVAAVATTGATGRPSSAPVQVASATVARTPAARPAAAATV